MAAFEVRGLVELFCLAYKVPPFLLQDQLFDGVADLLVYLHDGLVGGGHPRIGTGLIGELL